MTGLIAAQDLLARWWYVYDQGDFDQWPACFAPDAHFSCRTDSGTTAFEEFVRADATGRDQVLAWQEHHRRASPYPLRHNATNVHLAATRDGEVEFRSYLFVTQVVAGAVSNLASGTCNGTIREEEGAARFTDLRVVLDFTDSVPFDEAARNQP